MNARRENDEIMALCESFDPEMKNNDVGAWGLAEGEVLMDSEMYPEI